jgi:general secretion pathway protein K
MPNKLKLKPFKKKVVGSAIIVALLIMTLVAILATMMTVQQQTQIQRTMLVLNTDRLYLYAKAVEAWAIMQLTQDIEQAKEQAVETGGNINNTAIDVIPLSFKNITVANAFQISGQLNDLQGKFNLNNLTQKKYEENFVNLIMAVDPDFDPDEAKKIAKSVHDWVSKPTSNNSTEQSTTGQSTPANSAINKHYVQRHPPYRAAQALMASPSELRLIKGMTPGLYLRLQPFITALPKSTPININTASAPVIASLNHTIDLQSAMQIVQNRGDAPFNSMNDFLNDQTIQSANIKKSDVTMNSEYFLVTAQVNIGSDKLTLKAMLYRPLKTSNSQDNTANVNQQNQPPQPVVMVLWESRGGI